MPFFAILVTPVHQMLSLQLNTSLLLLLVFAISVAPNKQLLNIKIQNGIFDQLSKS